MRLKDRVAIVTGGSRGIGRAIAQALAREGARLAVTATTLEGARAAAEELRALGAGALPLAVDVSREDEVARMVEQTTETFGRIDILVNNAAVNLPNRRIVDLSLQEWEWVLRVNLTGAFLCSRAVLPVMMKQRSGKIINISSIGGRHGAYGRGPYRASKAGLINLTETLAAEAKEYGIDVNCICPGGVETDMMREISQGNLPPRLMKPEEIAAVVTFLASDESSAITGTAIDVWGGNNPLFR